MNGGILRSIDRGRYGTRHVLLTMTLMSNTKHELLQDFSYIIQLFIKQLTHKATILIHFHVHLSKHCIRELPAVVWWIVIAKDIICLHTTKIKLFPQLFSFIRPRDFLPPYNNINDILIHVHLVLILPCSSVFYIGV